MKINEILLLFKNKISLKSNFNIYHIIYLNNISIMDAADLLARENEFKKLNKQLEKKTETLMTEIENVMVCCL